MFKRILCALLAGMMLLPLASCSNSNVNSGDETKSQTSNPSNADSDSTANSEESSKYLDSLPETMNFGGTDIRFVVEEGSNGNLTEQSIYVEEDTGDVVDSAVYQRNGIVQDRLGINIVLQEVYDRRDLALLPALRTAVGAGTNDFDIVGFYQYYNIGAAAQGLVYNLNNLQYNDFDREYWATDYINNMSYKGATYWATGDLSLRYTGGMYVTFVNDRLWSQYYNGLDPYTLVDEGKWTLDKMYELSSGVYKDENANNTPDATEDTFGLSLICNDLINGMCAGAMIEHGSVDDEGNPYVTLNNERTVQFYEKMYNLLYNNPGYVESASDDSETLMNKFNEGRYMLTCNKLFQSAIYLRNMEDDFKIIPLPKLDETQPHYNTRVHDSVTLFGVPITATEKFDAISATLEALASESYRLVTPAYYEVALKTKFTRDSDSGRMIDLISQNVSSDFITLYSVEISAIDQFLKNQLAAQRDGIASSFKSNQKVWSKALESLIAGFESTAATQAEG